MGGSSSKGGGPSSTPASDTASQLSKMLFAETSPLRHTLESQGLEALKTGGTSASIPSIQRAVESSKASLSDTIAQINSNLASGGLGGTPFGAATKANANIAGEQGVTNAANAIGQWFMQMAPNLLAGQQQTATGLSGQAVGAESNLTAANTAAATSKGNAWLSFLKPNMNLSYAM